MNKKILPLVMVLLPLSVIPIVITEKWSNILGIALLMGWAIILTINITSWLSRLVDSPLQLKRKKIPSNLFFLIPVIFVISKIISDPLQNFFVIGLVLLFISYQIAIQILVKKKNPAHLYVSDRLLYIDDFFITQRDLSGLVSITFNASTERITLSFKEKSSIQIGLKNYEENDLIHFLNSVIRLSDEKVELSENMRLMLLPE